MRVRTRFREGTTLIAILDTLEKKPISSEKKKNAAMMVALVRAGGQVTKIKVEHVYEDEKFFFLLIFSNIFHRISLFAQRKPVRFYIACVSILNDVFDNVSRLVRGIIEGTRQAGIS